MKHEWLSVQIDCESPRGTEVQRAVLPLSNVTSVQATSTAAVIAQFLEAWEVLNTGQFTEININLSLACTMELDGAETMLVEKYKNKKGVARFDRFFAAALTKEVNRG